MTTLISRVRFSNRPGRRDRAAAVASRSKARRKQTACLSLESLESRQLLSQADIQVWVNGAVSVASPPVELSTSTVATPQIPVNTWTIGTSIPNPPSFSDPISSRFSVVIPNSATIGPVVGPGATDPLGQFVSNGLDAINTGIAAVQNYNATAQGQEQLNQISDQFGNLVKNFGESGPSDPATVADDLQAAGDQWQEGEFQTAASTFFHAVTSLDPNTIPLATGVVGAAGAVIAGFPATLDPPVGLTAPRPASVQATWPGRQSHRSSRRGSPLSMAAKSCPRRPLTCPDSPIP